MGKRMLVLVSCLVLFPYLCLADSITVGDKVYENVCIREGSSMYYVQTPIDGKLISVLKSKATNVTISEDKGLRDSLLREWHRTRELAKGASNELVESPARTRSPGFRNEEEILPIEEGGDSVDEAGNKALTMKNDPSLPGGIARHEAQSQAENPGVPHTSETGMREPEAVGEKALSPTQGVSDAPQEPEPSQTEATEPTGPDRHYLYWVRLVILALLCLGAAGRLGLAVCGSLGLLAGIVAYIMGHALAQSIVTSFALANLLSIGFFFRLMDREGADAEKVLPVLLKFVAIVGIPVGLLMLLVSHFLAGSSWLLALADGLLVFWLAPMAVARVVDLSPPTPPSFYSGGGILHSSAPVSYVSGSRLAS